MRDKGCVERGVHPPLYGVRVKRQVVLVREVRWKIVMVATEVGFGDHEGIA